ncbi:MAG: LysM peptidoglycan-binding domain-containing protein [Candidatus Omnitrophota bacterium]|nr:LysM peptidoglycan-binding domain-containing protein [Candidatus Omnitrophota bacterium]
MLTQISRKKVTQVAAIVIIGLVVSLTGCARFSTYREDRTDQNLQTGNRGCIYGPRPLEPSERKKERTRVNIEFEVPPLPEWRKHYWTDKEDKGNKGYIVKKDLRQKAEKLPGDETLEDESMDEGIYEDIEDEGIREEKPYLSKLKEIKQKPPAAYTVKKGETLRDIAGYLQIYNDSSKWPRIYEANKDKIKNPDFIYPGQILKIPREEKQTPVSRPEKTEWVK